MAANGAPNHMEEAKYFLEIPTKKKREIKKSLPLGPDRIFVFRLLYNLCLLAYDHPEKLP